MTSQILDYNHGFIQNLFWTIILHWCFGSMRFETKTKWIKDHIDTFIYFSFWNWLNFYIFGFSLNITDDKQNIHSQPKHIVFLSNLLLLFQFCLFCKSDKPDVDAHQEGTMAVVTTTCHNPKCPKRVNVWRSQPNMPGTQIAAGNFLLAFAVLVSGGSVTKVLTVFLHMGLSCITLRTFFWYQHVSAGP